MKQFISVSALLVLIALSGGYADRLAAVAARRINIARC